MSVPISAVQFLFDERAKIINNSITAIDEFVVSQNDVEVILKSVNVNKSSGSDRLGNLILKKCCDVISLPLSILFNQSLIDATFPTAWKNVDVCPI